MPSDVKLTVNNVVFENTNESGSQGYAVVLGSNAFDTEIKLNDCTFQNLYCAVYSNGVFAEPETEQSNPIVSITNSTYTNTTYGYSVDEVTNGAVVGGTDTTFTGNTGVDNEAETWTTVVATVTSDDVTKAYQSWDAAYTAAKEGDQVTLQQNITSPITIDKAITLEGNGKTITAENGDAITVTVAGVTLNNVNATAEGKNALGHALVVGTQDSAISGDVTVSGGTYVAEHVGMQGEGAIRIFANGSVTVKDTATTGGIHVFDAETYAITGNTVGFTYTGDTAYVGILVFYTNEQTDLDGKVVANGLVDGNTIAVPNTNSIYAQVVNGGWTSDDTSNVPATDSVAKIENNYYNTLQDAVDAVESNGIITVIADCNETVTISREVTFIIQTDDEAEFTGSVSAGSGYRVTKNGDTYTVEEYTSSSGGGGVTSYSIQVSDITDGQVTASKRIAQRGEEVTLTVTPAEGYELGTLTVTDRNGETVTLNQQTNGAYTFVMPASNVTIRRRLSRRRRQSPPCPSPMCRARLVL